MGVPLGNPAVAGVEVDICEHRVIDRVGKNIAGGVHQALHWDVRGKDHKSKTFVTGDLGLGDLSTESRRSGDGRTARAVIFSGCGRGKLAWARTANSARVPASA